VRHVVVHDLLDVERRLERQGERRDDAERSQRDDGTGQVRVIRAQGHRLPVRSDQLEAADVGAEQAVAGP